MAIQSYRVTTGQMVSGLPSSLRGPLEPGALIKVYAGHPRSRGDMEEGRH